MKQEIKLSEFLKEKGVYDKFVKNFDKEYYNDKGIGFYKYIAIKTAFEWSRSLEGYDYWDKLDIQWRLQTMELTIFNEEFEVYDMDWLLDEKEEDKESKPTPQQISNNNFEEFGFTKPEIKGHIYFKGVEGYYYGVIEEKGKTYTIIWNEYGKSFKLAGLCSLQRVALDKIELKWYDDRDKYDEYINKIIINKDGIIKTIEKFDSHQDIITIYCKDDAILTYNILKEQNWRLLTLKEAKQYIFS